MKIFIIFIGLIAQVNQPMSFDNTAVLLDAPDHEARLIIPVQSLINPDEWLKKQPTNGPNVEIDLKGAAVRVTGTRGVFSDLRRNFTDASPGLKTIAPGCKLRDEVRNRQIVPDELAAYVDFRGGHLFPHAYLPKKLSFTGTALEEPRCTVCRTRYEAELRGNHVTLVFKKKVTNPDGTAAIETHEIAVAGGRPKEEGGAGVPEIQISNKPPHAIEHHFKVHYNIYVGKCASEQLPPVVTSEKCTIGPICEQHAAEDTTSVADPGDDCTIVRHP